MNTNKLAKLLALSLIGGALMGFGSLNAETIISAPANSCVKPVQFYGKLNIVGSKTNYQAYLNLRNLLKSMKLLDDNGLLKNVSPVDKSKITFNLKKDKEEDIQKSEDMKIISRSEFDDHEVDSANYDRNDIRMLWQTNPVPASLKQESTYQIAGNCITITNTNTFNGNAEHIVPVNGDSNNGAYIDNNNTIQVVPQNQLTNVVGQQVSKRKIYFTPEITGGLPSIGYYGNNVDQISELVKQASEKSIFPGSVKGWQGSILLEVGGMFALPMGGFITLGVFFDAPIFGKTKTVELGKEDGSSNKDSKEDNNNKSNNSNSSWKYDIQEKWSFGGKLGFELLITEKVSIGLGVGFKYGKFLLSATGSDDKNGESTENKTYFLQQKHEMTGLTVFPEIEFKFFCTKNIFINVFARYYMPYELKNKDASSSDSEANDNNKNTGVSVSCRNLGGFAFGGGIGCQF